MANTRLKETSSLPDAPGQKSETAPDTSNNVKSSFRRVKARSSRACEVYVIYFWIWGIAGPNVYVAATLEKLGVMSKSTILVP